MIQVNPPYLKIVEKKKDMKAHTIYCKTYNFYKHELHLYWLPLYLLVLSSELLCNQNGHRSGRTKCRA